MLYLWFIYHDVCSIETLSSRLQMGPSSLDARRHVRRSFPSQTPVELGSLPELDVRVFVHPTFLSKDIRWKSSS